MSRAFVREETNEAALADIGERPISANRNLVTREGLEKIDAEIADLRGLLALADAEADAGKIALASRDLRYWIARRETAELSEPDLQDDVVRFGMSITIVDDDGKEQTWKIVGEDEAEVTGGKISHVSPMARALFGKSVGDVATVNGRDWEILSISV